MHQVNINARVTVKLTERGAKLVNSRNAEFNKTLRTSQCKTDYKAGDEYHSQLWSLMAEFGVAISMGSEVPFETEIQINLND